MKKLLLFFILFCLVGMGCLSFFYFQLPNLVLARHLNINSVKPDELEILVTGDTGSGNQGQKDVATLLERLCSESKPTGIFLLGDNFYSHGVSSVDDPQWNTKFADIYNKPCLKDTKFYAVLGNHDYQGNALAQIEYTTKSNNWWNLQARYYSASVGNMLDVFFADSNLPDLCGIPALCSIDYGLKFLTTSKAPWKFVLGHHPIISRGKYDRAKPYASWTLAHLMCQSNADFYVSGHDHNMQHNTGSPHPLTLAMGLVSDKCTINQIVAGSGGADLYDFKDSNTIKSEFFARKFGAVRMKLTPTQLTISFFDTVSQLPLYEIIKKKEP